jgi:primosomal protein N' (replication factor Y)
MSRFLRVALDTPAAAGTSDGLFDYRSIDGAAIGQLVIVPFGRQTLVGLVVDVASVSDTDDDRLRAPFAVVDGIAPLSADWIALNRFAARYYHRSLGEVALPSLPATLRRASAYRIDSGTGRATLPALDRARTRATKAGRAATKAGIDADRPLALNAMQTAALETLTAALRDPAPRPVLLYGVTGSGKTEVYLRAIEDVIAAGRQVLVLVPEINLTPQLAATFDRRLPQAKVASLHSGHAEGRRLHQWALAHEGAVDVLLGTRLAVLASLPRLGLIVVDEEHDASYKQHEGLRYSARDLAIVRAQQGVNGHAIPIVLASATPSLETWAQAERSRYAKVVLPTRAVDTATLPTIRLVPLVRAEVEHGIARPVREAIADRIARREPILVFHNRRGYAPVLACGACGWLSECPRCSVHAVFHKPDRRLHCHHCGWQHPVPRACPTCGNVDLAAVGRGTQRIEESLRDLFPTARVERIDRDSTRRKGAATALLDAVHDGGLDILVGTQMLAKGHDFRNVTLVCVLDADSALYSQDFRASERLFSNLMQVAGRAGRGGTRSAAAEVLIQTRAPEHPLFAALVAHDYERFARDQLDERERAGLPPFSFQAVLRAEAKTAEAALDFLRRARELAATLSIDGDAEAVTIYDPVPMTIARLANVERAQLLVEATTRRALRVFAERWLTLLVAQRGATRWHFEMDPYEI